MLEYAIEKARQANTGGRCKLYAIAVGRKRILGEGENNYRKSHPIMLKHSHNPNKVNIHAEAAALIKAIKTNDVIEKLYVARVRRTGEIGNAKPCKICERMIRWVEIEQGSEIEVIHT